MNTKMFNLVFNPPGTRNREYYTIGLSECIINGCSKEYYSGYYYMKFYLVMDVEFVGYCKWQIPCFGNCNFGNGLKFESFVPIYRILDIYEYELLK